MKNTSENKNGSASLLETVVAASMLAAAVAQGQSVPEIIGFSARPTATHASMNDQIYSSEHVGSQTNIASVKLKRGDHVFMHIVEKENGRDGLHKIGFYPGVDKNQDGTKIFLEPNSRGGQACPSIQNIVCTPSNIIVSAGGPINYGTTNSIGNWNSEIGYTFDPAIKVVKASGIYNIAVTNSTSPGASGNLAWIDSNRAYGPLFSGGTNWTGKMHYAKVRSENYWLNFNWSGGGHYPTDRARDISITCVNTNISEMDGVQVGYQPFIAAWQPTVSLCATSLTAEANISFGVYFHSQWSGSPEISNVQITPGFDSHTRSNFSYAISMEATALPGDGIGMDATLTVKNPDSLLDYVNVFQHDQVPFNGPPHRYLGKIRRQEDGLYRGTVSIPSIDGKLQNKGFIEVKE